MSRFKIGDRVRFRASSDPRTRTVYTGTIVEVCPGSCKVRDDGWGAISEVRHDRLNLVEGGQ